MAVASTHEFTKFIYICIFLYSTYFLSALPVFLKFCRVETAEKRRYVPDRNSWVASGTRKAEYIDYRVSTSVPT